MFQPSNRPESRYLYLGSFSKAAFLSFLFPDGTESWFATLVSQQKNCKSSWEHFTPQAVDQGSIAIWRQLCDKQSVCKHFFLLFSVTVYIGFVCMRYSHSQSRLFLWKKTPRFIVNKKEAVTFSVKCINQWSILEEKCHRILAKLHRLLLLWNDVKTETVTEATKSHSVRIPCQITETQQRDCCHKTLI